jgi:hypothetical protein
MMVSYQEESMKTRLSLRIASIVMFLFAAGHSLGGSSSWSPAGETDVLRAMRSVSFTTAGVSRTYLDFYTGFGWTLSIFMLLQAVLLWQIAAMAGTDPSRTRPMIAAFFVATCASAVVSWKLIIPVPVILSAILAAILAVAFFTAGRETRPAGVSE